MIIFLDTSSLLKFGSPKQSSAECINSIDSIAILNCQHYIL